MAGSRHTGHDGGLAADWQGAILPLPQHHRTSGDRPGWAGSTFPVDVDPAARLLVTARLGPLTEPALVAVAAGRGRDFQRLEFLGDALLELILHGHAVRSGPGCPLCSGRADVYTTDAHLTQVAHDVDLGDWLSWHPSEHRLADLVEACVAAAWWSGRWPAAVRFVATNVHRLEDAEARALLNGGSSVHPEAPARAREILGAAILEAAATINSFLRHPLGDEGDLSRLKARLLSTEHVMSRSRESKWVHRQLRTRHFVRDDVEAKLAEELLARGMAAAVTIALVLTG